jgi:transposase-like protein
MDTSTPFKWRHFQAEIILLCVRWYLRYPLSYRDLEEMMRERGLHVDHTTIYRSRATLRTRTGEALSASSQGDERLVARR